MNQGELAIASEDCVKVLYQPEMIDLMRAVVIGSPYGLGAEVERCNFFVLSGEALKCVVAAKATNRMVAKTPMPTNRIAMRGEIVMRLTKRGNLNLDIPIGFAVIGNK